VFLRLVPRLSVSVNTVLRVPLPRPLAADDDLPAPSSIADPSPKTNDLTSGRFACYKVVWKPPRRLGAQHGVTTRGPRSGGGGLGRRGGGAGGEKGFIFPIRRSGVAPQLTVISTPSCHQALERMRGTPSLRGRRPTRRWHIKRQQFPDRPAMIRDASGHRRCGPATSGGQTRMRCAKIIDRTDQIHTMP